MNDNPLQPDGDPDPLIRCVTEFLDSKGWKYHRDGDKPVVHFGFSGTTARWPCTAIADSKAPSLVFLSLLPSLVPPGRRVAVADLFARINWGLPHGCFELNIDNGEARFRTSQPLSSPEASLDMVGDLVFSNLWAVDRFFGVIEKVIHTKTSPKMALAILHAESEPKPSKAKPIDKKRRYELN